MRWKRQAALVTGCLYAVVAWGERAYVPNEGGGTLSIIDVSRDAEAPNSPIPREGSIGDKIRGVALSRDGSLIYVIDSKGDAVKAVDTATGAVRKTLPDVRSAEGIQLSPDGKTLAACAEASNEAVLIDVASFSIAARIPVAGRNPEHCVWSPDGHWLLASNEESHDIDVLDVAARKSVRRIAVSGAPRGMGFSPDGKTVYVANEGGGTVDIIGAGGEWPLQKSIATGLRPAGIAVAPKGDRVYISNGGAGTVSVLDTASKEIVASIEVGKRPWNMALSHDARKLYVACGRSDELVVIDTVANRKLASIAVGKLPWGVVID